MDNKPPIKVIIDTNLWISFLIGKQLAKTLVPIFGSSRFCVISLIDNMIDRSLCPLCLCGSFHPLALEKCILEYILPTKAGRADFFSTAT